MPFAYDRFVRVVIEIDELVAQPIQIGCRDVSIMPTAVRRLFGQDSGGPIKVVCQSNTRINWASSLSPMSGPSDSIPFLETGVSASTGRWFMAFLASTACATPYLNSVGKTRQKHVTGEKVPWLDPADSLTGQRPYRAPAMTDCSVARPPVDV
jgi:hypothetical protein